MKLLLNLFDLKKLRNYFGRLGIGNKETYTKSICEVCNQLCYNEKDLNVHIRTKHSDLSSKKFGSERM